VAASARDETARSPGRRGGRAIVVYTAARAGLLALCLVLGWVAGFSGPVLLILALLVSGLLSWFLLRRQRIAMGGAVERKVGRLHERIDSRAAAEDAYVDTLEVRPPAAGSVERRQEV
jgi:Protein of unknown function (DUF4229)